MAFSIGKFNSPPSSKLRQSETPIDNFRQRILTQNRALAKKNSFLMTKISDLESKVADLIQENIELRAVHAKAEDKKRKWFDEKLNLIEEGVSQRFDEMLQMFTAIRSSEGLPPSTIQKNHLLFDSTRDIHSSDKTVSFQNVKSPKLASRSERRRKSLRRQSIYIAPPSPSTLKEGDEAHESSSHSDSIDQTHHDGKIHIHFNDENPFDEKSNKSNRQEPQGGQEQQQGQDKITNTDIPHEDREEQLPQEIVTENIEQASSFSPIRFSSPRLEELKKSNFVVYEDSPEAKSEKSNSKIQQIAFTDAQLNNSEDIFYTDLSDELSDEQKPLVRDTNKVKHTNSKTQKQKPLIDEGIPGSSIEEELFLRKSRTRGKSVSYAEPSLRAKMRRQSEKFVDAVVTDAFVKGVSRYSAPLSQSKKQEIIINQHVNAEAELPRTEEIQPTKKPLKISTADILHLIQNSPPKSILEVDSSNITKKRKPLSSLNSNTNKVPKNSNVMNKPELDLQEENQSEQSVFDLVEESAVGVPKTYKGKPDISTKRKSGRRHSMVL